MIRLTSRLRGFTLLEVLVALVFFALIGITLQRVTASTVSQYHHVRLKIFAAWIAENKMAELHLSKSLPNAREHKEELDYANMEWQLISKVKTTDNPDINKVDIDVLLIDSETDAKSQKFTLTGFVGRY